TSPVAITGPGSGALTISGNNASRIFLVDDGSTVVQNVAVSGMSLIKGNATDGVGGAIAVASDNLALRDVVLIGNTAVNGGGIYLASNGRLTLENSTVSNNVSTYLNGGGLYLDSHSTVVIRNSVISGNRTGDGTGFGGGGGVLSGGFLTVEGSTISDNRSTLTGGGIFASGGALVVRNSTVSGSSGGEGGGMN